eukprot:3091447-Heterocapsa_arctica.AAC.1
MTQEVAALLSQSRSAIYTFQGMQLYYRSWFDTCGRPWKWKQHWEPVRHGKGGGHSPGVGKEATEEDPGKGTEEEQEEKAAERRSRSRRRRSRNSSSSSQ